MRLHRLDLWNKGQARRPAGFWWSGAASSQLPKDLVLPHSRVSEVVQQFERQLGVRLPIRTTRQVTPTAEGEDYYQRALRILYAFDNGDSAVSFSVPAGPLRVDVHGTFARRFLLPGPPDLLDKHPGIRLHIEEVHIAIAAYSVS